MIKAIENNDHKELIKLMDAHRSHSRTMLSDMLGPSVPSALLSLPQSGAKFK